MIDTTTIKGYDLQGKIGEGGFGAVYRAYQPSVGREVAIKIILPQYANHPDFIRRFETEAQLVARLEHFHIVPLYDYWREPDGAYLVMRYLRGGSLRETIKSNGSLRADTVVKLVEQISSALDLAHRNGVIHRDLKPSNILLDDEDNFYLTDFGIAKDLGSLAQVTQPGEVAITPAYASPEQARGEIVAPQTDIYAMGIMIYEVLSGKHPFSGVSHAELVVKHQREPLPCVRDLCPDLPESVDAVIQKATAKDALQRYRDVRELAAAVRDAFDVDGERVIEGERTHTPVDFALPLTNPYKGLRPFDEADASDFFGREALTERLLNRLQEDGEYSRFLAVVGPSGSGKSSVVRAGLIPALRQGKIAGSENWYVAGMLPGSHPVEELEIALTHIAAAPDLNLIPTLRENERGLLRAVRKVLPTDAELTLIIDQFEEVFTLIDDPARARHFMDLIVATVTDPRSPIRIIITLRADFYDRPLMIPDFSELIRHRTEVVVPMSPDELERAISTPAKRVGVKLEQGLTAAIIAEINEQPGALPMLQYALTELFECRDNRTLTLDCYHSIGGTLGALARRADEVFNGLNAEQQAASRQLFLRLVTLGEGTEDTRRRTLRSELVSAGGAVMDSVIDKFDQSRLLTFDRDPLTREPTVEVAHEAILREWGQLRNWLDESRYDIRQQRLLAAAAADWMKAERDESYLLHGSRLEQFEAWSETTEIALTEDEKTFLNTSVMVETKRQTQRRRIRNAVLVSAIVLSAVMSILALFALNARSAAETERDNTERALIRAEREAAVNHSLVLASKSQQEYDAGKTDLALTLALEAVKIDEPPSEAQRTLMQIAMGPGRNRIYDMHSFWVLDAAFSPDGQMVLSGSCEWDDDVGCVQSELYLWSVDDGDIIRRFPPQQHVGICSVDFSPRGDYAISGSCPQWREGEFMSNPFDMILWDVESGELLYRFSGHNGGVFSVAFSSDGNMAVSSAGDGFVRLWDVTTGEVIRRFEGHVGVVRVAAFHPNGQWILSAAADGTIRLWDIDSGEEIRRFEGHESTIHTIAVSPNGQLLLSAGADFNLRSWDIETGDQIESQFFPTQLFDIAISPDGYTATFSDENRVYLWDIENWETIFSTLQDQYGGSGAAAISPDGQLGLFAPLGTVYVFNLQALGEVRRFPTAGTQPLSLDITADGRHVLTGTLHNGVLLWDTAQNREIRRFGSDEYVFETVFNLDESFTLAASADFFSEGYPTSLVLWDIERGEEIHRFEGFTGLTRAAAISPDGRTALAGSHCWGGCDAAELFLLDLTTGEIIRRFEPSPGITITSVVFSADGQRAITGSGIEGYVTLWDVTTGRVLKQFEGHTETVNDVAFGPNEKTILSGSVDSTMILWDVESGNALLRFVGHGARIHGVDISPDGRYAISASTDQTVILWDIQTGEEIRRYSDHGGAVYDVQFSPDGQTAYSVSPNGTFIEWDVTIPSIEELVNWVYENRYIRDFTCDERVQYRIEPYCE